MYSLDYGILTKDRKHGFGLSLNFNRQHFRNEEHSSFGWGLQYRHQFKNWVFRSELGWAEVNIINNQQNSYEFISLNNGFNLRQEVGWNFWKGLNVGGGFSYFPKSLSDGVMGERDLSLFYPHLYIGYNWERSFKKYLKNDFNRRRFNDFIFEKAFIFNLELSPFIVANNFSFSFGYHLRPDVGLGLTYNANGSLTFERNSLIQYGFGVFYQRVSDKYILRGELGHIQDAGLRPENSFRLSSPIYELNQGFTPYSKLIAALRTRRNWLIGVAYTYTTQSYTVQEFDDYGKRINIEDKRLHFHLPTLYLGTIVSTKRRKD
jgi:hypothetical protein